MSNQLSVGIIGCGSIGSVIAARGKSFRVVCAYDTDKTKLESYVDKFKCKGYTDFSEFLSHPADVIVEAASPKAVEMFGCDVLKSGKDIIVLSVGALANAEFREKFTECARETGHKIYVSSGAILGLDGISVAQFYGADVLKIRTTKPPKSLGLLNDERRCVFSGKASDCIKLYPKNVNVSVSLSLSGGTDADVELWADPSTDKNTHEIFFSGEYGEAYIKIENVPLPENPATSYRAALSVLSILESFNNPVVIGR